MYPALPWKGTPVRISCSQGQHANWLVVGHKNKSGPKAPHLQKLQQRVHVKRPSQSKGSWPCMVALAATFFINTLVQRTTSSAVPNLTHSATAAAASAAAASSASSS